MGFSKTFLARKGFEMKQIFDGVFRDGNRIYTRGTKSVYGERLISADAVQLREWLPERSKLGAAIVNGLSELPIKPGSIVLYLGASTGTTISHVSDIIGNSGIVYGIEFAERVLRSLFPLAEDRKNIAAIKADARKPEDYAWVEECDVLFCDVADPQETEMAIRNAREFLRGGGYLMMAIKSQSIDVTKQPKQVYQEERKKLENAGFSVVQMIDLEPHEEKHAMIITRK